MTSLKLSVIRTDAGTQSRAGISEEVVTDYAERMVEGDKFPAVVVFHDGTDYFLADGFHRVLACARCEFLDVLADVRTGTRLDAVKYSLGANISNGLRRSTKDKRRCVEIALKEFATMSNRAIAQICGVSDMMVGAIRNVAGQVQESCTSNQLQESCSSPRVGLDGKTRNLPTRQPEPQVEPEPIAPPSEDEEQVHIARAQQYAAATLMPLAGALLKHTTTQQSDLLDTALPALTSIKDLKALRLAWQVGLARIDEKLKATRLEEVA